MLKVYWHWTATPYWWCVPNHYHWVATWDAATKTAKAHLLTPFGIDLYDHTAYRNTGSIAMAISCMAPGNNTWSNPPQPAQIDLLVNTSAKLAVEHNIAPKDLYKHFMTHAEAAALRDYPRELVAKYSEGSPLVPPGETFAPSTDWDHMAQEAGLPHANYGPRTWPDKWPGGDVARWDLFQLTQASAPGSGGHELRLRMIGVMKKLKGTA